MRRTMVGALMVAAMVLPAIASPVSAFPLTNCTLQATALGADGKPIDSIKGGADDATQSNPFLVDWDGTVSYTGAAQVEMKNNSWHVDVFGVPIPLSGRDDNTEDNRDGNGSVGVSANAPFRITGLYYVLGSLTGSGGTCTGSGWFKLTGDPISTIPFFIALGLLMLGLLMLAYGARGHAITAVVGGILAGLGLGTLLVLFSTLPLGSPTAIIVVGLGLLLGIIVALLGRRARRDDSPPMLPPTNRPTAPPPGTSTPA